MKNLTKIENTVLIAVWRLGEDAYGVNVKRMISEFAGKDVLYSTLYTTFEQLGHKGFLTKRFGEPTAMRGGKRKVFFQMSKTGLFALERAFENQQIVWGGITKGSFRRGLTG